MLRGVKLRKLDVVLAAGAAALDVSALLRESADVSPFSVAIVAASSAALLARRRAPLLVIGGHPGRAADCAGTWGSAVRRGGGRLRVHASPTRHVHPPCDRRARGRGARHLRFRPPFHVAARGRGDHRLRAAHPRETWAQRDEIGERAALRERTAIARELHDIVAHSVSVMLVGVRGARDVIATEPEVAYATSGASRTARNAAWPSCGARSACCATPTRPSRSRHSPRCTTSRRSSPTPGCRYACRPRANCATSPTGSSSRSYRLVQEALTNVRKHAQATHADVILRFGEDTLGVEVRRRRRRGQRRRRPGPRRDARAGGDARRRARTRLAPGRRLPRGGDAAHPMIRVLIADDQDLIRTGFRLFLGTHRRDRGRGGGRGRPRSRAARP